MPSPMRACTRGIRMFSVPRVSSKTPLDDCDAAWQTATPASVGQFSAVGYFFGRMLYKALGIPVGLITSNWGGSTIEAWMTVEAIDATPGHRPRPLPSREPTTTAFPSGSTTE